MKETEEKKSLPLQKPVESLAPIVPTGERCPGLRRELQANHIPDRAARELVPDNQLRRARLAARHPVAPSFSSKPLGPKREAQLLQPQDREWLRGENGPRGRQGNFQAGERRGGEEGALIAPERPGSQRPQSAAAKARGELRGFPPRPGLRGHLPRAEFHHRDDLAQRPTFESQERGAKGHEGRKYGAHQLEAQAYFRHGQEPEDAREEHLEPQEWQSVQFQ